jgi:uncharacterized zinc-type alcohol dehydrogenase-like protein
LFNTERNANRRKKKHNDKAFAAFEPGGKLSPFEYDPGPLGAEQVEIDVEHCGICHSYLSMLNNEWQMTEYPFIPGHEVIGTVSAVGAEVIQLEVGQRGQHVSTNGIG